MKNLIPIRVYEHIPKILTTAAAAYILGKNPTLFKHVVEKKSKKCASYNYDAH